MLRELEAVPNSGDYRDEPRFSIWSALAHQAMCTQRRSQRCRMRYVRSRRLQTAQGQTTSTFLRGLRSATNDRRADSRGSSTRAIAVAKGSVDVAEAVLELTSEVAGEFLEWSAQR